MTTARDLPRQSNNQIRIGTVAVVDLARGLCRVQAGEIQTDFVPWFVPRAGAVIEWSAPSVGEQVLLLSPGGDVSGAASIVHASTASSAAVRVVMIRAGRGMRFIVVS